MGTNLIVLAAGQGTRMQSDTPKVLHKLAGRELFAHALAAGAVLEPEATVLVVGAGAEALTEAAVAFDPEVKVAIQDPPQGTGDAVRFGLTSLDGAVGDTVVLYADTPFIQPGTLDKMAAARAAGHDVVVLGFQAADPARYGRLVMAGDVLERIVEFKEASHEERAITLCNSGVVMADIRVLSDLLSAVTNDNESGEYYLTDIVGIARSRGLSATVVTCPEAETLGINSRADLATAEAVFQDRARVDALANGVTLIAPQTVYFSYDTVVGRDALIEPNVVFGPEVTVETGATIRAFSHLEGCHVSRGAVVGPYARLRPGAELAENTKVGNFVEIKNATLAEGAKVNHLSYIGDASVGAAANVGAGTVTCNYDGVSKHRTEIGARAFIGSDTMLVAPVRVGDEAMTASGSVITRDVPDGALAVGRAPQITKPGLARRMFEKLKSAKVKRVESNK
jgi:bifunctional UDP-N-acetylglucosamine pyrophosphorylase / glucosamine-1-phosphate N-acetyltransferase